MTAYDFVEASFQRSNVKGTHEAQAHRNVVNRAIRFQLFQEPYPLLGERERSSGYFSRGCRIHWQRLNQGLFAQVMTLLTEREMEFDSALGYFYPVR